MEAKNKQVSHLKIATCLFCGAEFTQRHEKHKYCSVVCNRRMRKHKNQPLPESGVRNCLNCGKKYYYKKGQKNWGKGGPKNGGGSVRSDLYCSFECGVAANVAKKIETCFAHYGVNSPLQSEIIQEKASTTYKKKTGYSNPSQNPQIKEKKMQTCLKNWGVCAPSKNPELYAKQRETMKSKYGVYNPSQLGWVKRKKENTCLKNYGVEYYTQTEEYQQRVNAVKKKNCKKHMSTGEKAIYNLLSSRYSTVIYQYRSLLYPFNCDFYVPEKDLYIEFQGYWTHGGAPFDGENIKHTEKLKKWDKKSKETNFKGEIKYSYITAKEIWTQKDPYKREVAKLNNLNWLEFFDLKSFQKWFYKQEGVSDA